MKPMMKDTKLFIKKGIRWLGKKESSILKRTIKKYQLQKNILF